MRAILDANILVSAVIKTEGKPAQILRRATIEFDWLTSEYLIAEVARVLIRPRIQKLYAEFVAVERRMGFLARMRDEAEMVAVKRTVDPASRDAHDDPILASAADGHADYIVTGDLDLLTLGEFEGIQIVTPVQFLKILDAARAE
ncbi:MAG: putative toxin-antitoxin system toxin component, PIN family [Chloroflexi bacterium]|nr:putative toxin-antitoxin system toxin component, PIN family [Chloroflexota bacterium]